MDKYEDGSLVEPTDAIVLLNDNYQSNGLYAGYIGVVAGNFIKQSGFVLADFFNPLTGDDIAVLVEIKKEDFRVLSNTPKDRRFSRDFKALFRK